MSTIEQRPAEIPLHLSYEEYLAWDACEGGLTEWVSGEVAFHMAFLEIHQRVVAFMLGLLGLFVDIQEAGHVYIAPFTMRAIPQGNAREPDLLYLSNERMGYVTEKALEGPADLVIEVISADSVLRDREEKFYEYRDAGVREYWIIDPRPGKHQIDGYQLDLDGTYLSIAPDAERRYHSLVLPGFWFRPAWLWQEPRIDPFTALMEMRGLAPDAIQMIRTLLKDEAS